jgi:hypothetical protein
MRDQDRLVLLWGATPDSRYKEFPFSWDGVREFVQRPRTLESVAYYGYEGAAPVTVREGEQVSSLRRSVVSGNFFSVLGSTPIIGRAFTEADNMLGAAPVALLSYSAWQQRFGGDRNVLGRHIDIHETGVAYAIIGVMPQGLDYLLPARSSTRIDPVISLRAEE